MKIRVDTVPEAGEQIEGSIDPSAIQLDMPGYSLAEPVTFTGRASKSGEDVYVQGRLRGEARAECSRCLKVFKMPLDLEVNIMYVPSKELLGKEEKEIKLDSNLSFYEGDTIDLLREVRDLILVNLPIKPICRSDCKGLCLQCGADLNVSTCECEQRPEGSPFDKLKDLRSKLKEK